MIGKWRSVLGFLAAVVSFASLLAPVTPALAAATVTKSTLTSSVRVGRTTYDYTFTVTVSNTTPALANAIATVTSSVPTTVVTKSTVNLGTLAANSTTTSSATYVLQVDLSVPFDPSKLSIVVNGTPAPSALSYSTPPPLLVGKAISPLTATVTGSVNTYSATPSLPVGLTINGSTGVISGTPLAATAAATYTITASNVTGSTTFGLDLRVDSGPTVHLIATATDAHGNSLAYQWKTTDGMLLNANGAQADWMLPAGPGLHFAYVLVSNGMGGYAEQRVAVSTDAIGNPAIQFAPVNLAAPAGPTQQGDYYRSFVGAARTSTPYFSDAISATAGHMVNVSGATVNLLASDFSFFPTSGPPILSNQRGEYLIPGVPIGVYEADCRGGLNTQVNCTSKSGQELGAFGFTMLPAAITDWYPGFNSGGSQWPYVVGTLRLSDDSPCGISDEFFGVKKWAVALYSDASGNLLLPGNTGYGPVSVNEFMDFALPSAFQPFPVNTPVFVHLTCENVPPLIISVPNTGSLSAGVTDLGLTRLAATSAPKISTIVASFQQQVIASFTAPDPSTPKVPSDINPRPSAFLAVKGLDSRLGACQYYKAVGAVQSCDSAGTPSGAISFEDWKRAVKIGSYASAGAKEYTATFINKMDLNLARNHHSISYGPGQTAAYVCNHSGPTVLDPSQTVDTPGNPSIDTVIANTIQGKNLVACVAMDFAATSGVNVDAQGVNQPFTRFLIFGPSGQLLPSVNLDGRGEKFVPGTCVACHGGDHYAGQFPEDRPGVANIGAHFLPYDPGNFEFSSVAGLTLADQEEAIYQLNQNVLNAGPTVAEQELIAGWYGSASHNLDLNYVPVSWQARTAAGINYYKNIYSHYCRSCHVAMTEGYNFDHSANYLLPNGTYRSNGTFGFLATEVSQCGTDGSAFGVVPTLSFSMPNSLVTFNRFWALFGDGDPSSLQTQTACSQTVAGLF
jgi:hypothetical protein